MMWWGVVLVTYSAAAFAASEEPAEPPSDTDEIPVYNTNKILVDERNLDTWDMTTERAKRKSCDGVNGKCISKKDALKSCKGALDMRYKCVKNHFCCITDISEVMMKEIKKEFKQIDTNQEILLKSLNACNSRVDDIIEQIEPPITRSDTKLVRNTKDSVASLKVEGKSCDDIGGKCISIKKALKSCKGVIDRTYECKNKQICCITDTSAILMEVLKNEIQYREDMQETLITNLKECNSQLNYIMKLLETAQCISSSTIDSSTTAEASSTISPASSTVKYLDDLSTNELWLHILYQFDRPYENRTIYRGDCDYSYYLDTEIYDPTKNHTAIIIPTMKDFTTGKGRFNKLFNYSKGRNVTPSLFDPDVKEALIELYTLYKENPGAKGILYVAANAKDYVNEYLHMYGLMHTIIYDRDLYGYSLPAFYEVIPGLFAEGCNAPQPDCCKIDGYPQDLTGDEWKISYYREDSAYNGFHGKWHQYNPHSNIPLNHGELFFYFHNQLIARYNMERLSNGLDTVTPLHIWNSDHLIPQNYAPSVLTGSLTRCANMHSEPLNTLSSHRQTLENAISYNQLEKANGSPVDLNNDNGIKYVGCAFENAQCAEADINYAKYGSIHNSGHMRISGIGCHSFSRKVGVMANTWSAVRDPIFFRWHKYVDDVFQLHKNKLNEYSISELVLDGVLVSSIGVHSTGREGELHTFNSILNMTMWFGHDTSTCIIQPTINHFPFTYNIIVHYKNKDRKDIDVNVRIYLAPKSKKASYEELRTQWALMDRFNASLKIGTNTITRESCSSSITAPPPKTIQELSNIYKDLESYNEFISTPQKCQCGLPEHLLIPRGTPEGMPYQLFVYITPRDNSQSQSADCPNKECGDLCSSDYTSCLKSDGEPMGFPFDRPLTTLDGSPINTIEDLVNKLPNAQLHDNIKIFYNKDIQNNNRQCSN